MIRGAKDGGRSKKRGRNGERKVGKEGKRIRMKRVRKVDLVASMTFGRREKN